MTRDDAAPARALAVDPDRRQWLERLCAACERVLASDTGDPNDPSYAYLLSDVSELLERLRAELRTGSL